MTYSVNQIVRGKVAGVFVIVGVKGADYVVKEVNPKNHAQTAPGESIYSADMLRPYA